MGHWSGQGEFGRNERLDMCAFHRGQLPSSETFTTDEARLEAERLEAARQEEGHRAAMALLAAAFPGTLSDLREIARLRLIAKCSITVTAKLMRLTYKQARVRSRYVTEQMDALRSDREFWKAFALRKAYNHLMGEKRSKKRRRRPRDPDQLTFAWGRDPEA